MLLGYNEITGNIEFLFSDDTYLEKQFQNNTAKITNFWKNNNHGLKEFFISNKYFTDYLNYRLYKIVDNKIIKKTDTEIQEDNEKMHKKKQTKKNIQRVGNFLSYEGVKIRELENKIKLLENELEEYKNANRRL